MWKRKTAYWAEVVKKLLSWSLGVVAGLMIWSVPGWSMTMMMGNSLGAFSNPNMMILNSMNSGSAMNAPLGRAGGGGQWVNVASVLGASGYYGPSITGQMNSGMMPSEKFMKQNTLTQEQFDQRLVNNRNLPTQFVRPGELSGQSFVSGQSQGFSGSAASLSKQSDAILGGIEPPSFGTKTTRAF